MSQFVLCMHIFSYVMIICMCDSSKAINEMTLYGVFKYFLNRFVRVFDELKPNVNNIYMLGMLVKMDKQYRYVDIEANFIQ